jgi:hypothetical protein
LVIFFEYAKQSVQLSAIYPKLVKSFAQMDSFCSPSMNVGSQASSHGVTVCMLQSHKKIVNLTIDALMLRLPKIFDVSNTSDECLIDFLKAEKTCSPMFSNLTIDDRQLLHDTEGHF